MFHVGSARSSLFNWAFAKQRGGAFVLRIGRHRFLKEPAGVD